MKIDLLSHPTVGELVLQMGLELTSVHADPMDDRALILHSTERRGDTLYLLVDHSHFTATRTEIAIRGDDAEKVAAQILHAIQQVIVELQTRTFTMLTSVNAAAINSLDVNEIVHNVLRAVMKVLPHSDAGVFRLFDEESGFLIPVSHEGLPEDYTYYRVQPNESISGEVFATGLPAIHNGRQNIIAAHRVMRPESQSFMERSEIANALLCVPVMAEGKRLGTLTTLCFSSEGGFSAYDRSVLEALAAQIAVAYQRSLAYQNEVANSHRLEQMRSVLAQKNSELDRAVELHEALLRIFSTGEGLVEQLHAVAELFRVDFRFENVMGLEFRSTGWIDESEPLRQSVEVAEAPVGHFHFRASEDVAYQRALFGTLATFVALDFVRDMSRMDVMNARKKAHFEVLGAGHGTDNSGIHHGFRSDRYNQVFVSGSTHTEISGNPRLLLYKIQSGLERGLTVPNALAFHHESQVVMLVSASTAAALDRNLRSLSQVAHQNAICVGASEIYEASEHHLTSRDLAAQAAEAQSRRGRPGLLRHQEMGVELLLQGRKREEVLEFTRQILNPLLRDPRHQVLFETLARYVHEGKHVSSTANALGIHSNTLYQRLQRVEALTGRKIADTADFTLLCLACQLHTDYAGSGSFNDTGISSP